MSKKKKKRRQKKSRSLTQPIEKGLRKEKSLLSFLRNADGCFPTDSDSAGISHDIIFVESGHLLTREMQYNTS